MFIWARWLAYGLLFSSRYAVHIYPPLQYILLVPASKTTTFPKTSANKLNHCSYYYTLHTANINWTHSVCNICKMRVHHLICQCKASANSIIEQCNATNRTVPLIITWQDKTMHPIRTRVTSSYQQERHPGLFVITKSQTRRRPRWPVDKARCRYVLCRPDLENITTIIH